MRNLTKQVAVPSVQANQSLSATSLAANKLWIEARKLERARYDELVKGLKVVIPQNLRGIYEKVSAVANAR